MRRIRHTAPLALIAALAASSALADNAAAPSKVVSVAAPGADGRQAVSYARALPDGTPADIASADPAYPIGSFAEALQRVYWTNPNLLAERARTRATDYRLPQARSQFGPRIDRSAHKKKGADRFPPAPFSFSIQGIRGGSYRISAPRPPAKMRDWRSMSNSQR